jgi:N-acetylneuraminic acid mutarotase
LGFDSNGGYSVLNDLWRYNPTLGQWTWISGSNVANANGAYGAQGTAAAGNMPGARYSAVPSTDGIGNLWLFGGYGRDANGSAGQLNDLWQYNPSSGQWTWVGGSDSVYAVSVYGTEGTPAPGNVPGSLQYMVSWTDAMGNFWLFGGYGNAATSSGTLNTLWKY